MNHPNASKLAIIFYDNKCNKNSINALIAALEDSFPYNNIYLCNQPDAIKINLKALLDNKYKVVIAFSCLIGQYKEIKSIIANINKEFEIFHDQYRIVVGGPVITGAPELAADLKSDNIIIGEGEESFLKFINAFEQGNDYKNICGLGYVNDKIVKYNICKNLLDINNYKPFPVKYNRVGAIEISRGCSYSCYYCQTSYMHFHQIRHRSIDNICSYVMQLYRNNFYDFRFITSNAFLYASKDGRNPNFEELNLLLKSIRNIIKDRGRIFFGTFPSEVRPEHVNDETIALIKRYANNNNIIIGCQSGSDKILKICNRQHKVDDIYNAVKFAIKNNIIPNLDFIFGLPGEDNDTLNDSLNVINDLTKLGAKIHGHIFIPLPGTPFWDMDIEDIPLDLIHKLELLCSRGLMYGQWRKQLLLREEVRSLKHLFG